MIGSLRAVLDHTMIVQRIELDERETRVIWHQGLRSLRSGVLLFLIGLLFSSEFLAPAMPAILQ